jgi:serine/threonine-protein kinase
MLFASSATAGDGATPAAPKRGMMVGVAVAAGAVIAVGLWFATRPPPAPTTGATNQSSSGAAVAAAAEVELSITASPADAKISLDGKALSGNPFKGKVASDKLKHQLAIEAAGHAPLIKLIDLDSNLELQLALTKLNAPTAPSTATAAPEDRQPTRRQPVGGPLVVPDDPVRPPTKKPQRTIDPNNPYPENQ